MIRRDRLWTALALMAACTSTPDSAATASADAALTVDAAADTTPPPADTATVEPDVAQPADVPKGPPKARIFPHDPVTDNQQTTEVALLPPTSPDGSLTSPWVAVSNCLQEEGGLALGGGFGSLCHEVATVKPGEDGHYLHVTPPPDHGQAGDPFAEVQMYHHVNVMHDWYRDGFGLTDLDFPLPALVNVTIKTLFGGNSWQGFPNAAFMPPEAFEQFGLPKRDKGAIVFGQYGDTDFSYDASVIYHEYTHAMIGTTRLVGVVADSYGLDNLPGAMNEGFADYFSSSLRNDPLIGAYALTFAGEHLRRDLTKKRRCPDDLTTEIHADGKIVGSALWAMRQKLGQSTADTIVLNALQGFTKQTSLTGAAKLIVGEAKALNAETGAQVQSILEEYGWLACNRAKKLEKFWFMASPDQVPLAVEGKQALGVTLPEGVPGYVQLYVDVPAGAKGVTVSWTAQAGQQGFGPGGGAMKLRLAIRKGKPAELFMIDGSLLADKVMDVAADPKDAKGQRVTLTGKCLPAQGGKVYLMFLNKNNGRAEIVATDGAVVDDPAKAGNVVTCE